MRKLTVMAATVMLIASAHRAAADDGPPQPVQVVAYVLQLSDQQLASWVDILHTRQQALEPLQRQLQMHQEAIGRSLRTPAPDPQALGQLVIETRAIEQQIAAVASQSANQFEQLLTSEQRERLQQIRSAAQVCPAVPAFAAAGLL